MPVTYDVNVEGDFAWIRFGSRFTLEEVVAAVSGFRERGGMECRRLFEFERPIANIRFESIKDIGAGMRPSGAGKAIALVADNDLSREVCDAIARQVPAHLPVQIFDSRPAAEAWLKSQPSSPSAS
jgi:hypothetical protein